MKKLFLSLLLVSAVSLGASAATIWVDVQDDYFRPYNLYVPAGTTVTWTNYGIHTHTVTSNTGLFNSGDLTHGQSYSYTFNTAGDYNYNCIYHVSMGMVGVVRVRTTASLTWLLTTTPIGGPPVIPASGGSFQYTATLTNQTSGPQPFQYWTKAYLPNMTPYSAFGPLAATLQGGQTKSKNFTQTVPNIAPAGSYHHVSYVGTMPDTVLAWGAFDFTKSATDEMSGWEATEISDWYDTPSAPAAPSTQPSQPGRLSLSNSPEPFNPSTMISFTLPQAGVAQLDVFNVLGARVSTLVNGYRKAGQQEVTFDASHLPSGLYVYRLSFGGESIVNKMVLAK